MDKKQELLELIAGSGIDEQDVERWELLLDAGQEEAVQIYHDVFADFPEEIHWFNEILKRKIAAMELIKNGEDLGQSEMKEIVDEERIKLKELAEKSH